MVARTANPKLRLYNSKFQNIDKSVDNIKNIAAAQK
jgi:hypothetical protein